MQVARVRFWTMRAAMGETKHSRGGSRPSLSRIGRPRVIVRCHCRAWRDRWSVLMLVVAVRLRAVPLAPARVAILQQVLASPAAAAFLAAPQRPRPQAVAAQQNLAIPLAVQLRKVAAVPQAVMQQQPLQGVEAARGSRGTRSVLGAGWAALLWCRTASNTSVRLR